MTKCELCGEPMPAGEEMFKYHGYSGPCPEPKERELTAEDEALIDKAWERHKAAAPKKRTPTYDSRCYDLGLHFLDQSCPEHGVKMLAQHIQEAVEAWLGDHPEFDPELRTGR